MMTHRLNAVNQVLMLMPLLAVIPNCFTNAGFFALNELTVNWLAYMIILQLSL